MAQRRMFSKHIVRSEEFLEMPEGSQLLYFHLGMEADDDGCVQPAQVMRLTQAKPDALKVLEAKSFVLPLEGGRVMVITHWKVNNWIQKDRYQPSLHRKLLTASGINQDENQVYTKCIHNVSIGKDSIGKVSIGYCVDEKSQRKPKTPTPIESEYYALYKNAMNSDCKLSGTEYVILNKYAKENTAWRDMLRTYFSLAWAKEYDYAIRAFVKVESQRHIVKEMGKHKFESDKEATKKEYDDIVKKLNSYGDTTPEVVEKEIRPLEKQRDLLREKLYRMHVL